LTQINSKYKIFKQIYLAGRTLGRAGEKIGPAQVICKVAVKKKKGERAQVGPTCMADVALGHATHEGVVSLPRYSDADALEENGGDLGTYRRRVATAKGWAEWRRPGAVQGWLGDAPFLPQQLLPAGPPPRMSSVGQRRRRSPAILGSTGVCVRMGRRRRSRWYCEGEARTPKVSSACLPASR
jgi:hypothetical protein